MKAPLSTNQLRVLGCLIEKQITTPDHYPLTLNALTSACNQKTNREPVMRLTEADVVTAVETLKDNGLVTSVTGKNARALKYAHRFCNTEFSDVQLGRLQLSLLCVLMLRGPQTAGELRARTQKFCEFQSIGSVETALSELSTQVYKPLVEELPREPGKRERRWQQLVGEQESPEPAIEDHSSLNTIIEELQEKQSNLTDLLMRRLSEQDELIADLQDELTKLASQYTELKYFTDELLQQRPRRLP
jgi:uncharacterized protein